MNLQKLIEAEKDFMELYPKGFKDPGMEAIRKKHKPEKLYALAQDSFAKNSFDKPLDVLENMIKVVSRSSMVSLFEKPKFRDYARSLNKNDSNQLVDGLKIFLYENEELGFNMMLEILQKGKLAKWSIITVWLSYFRPDWEVFVKPTTVKGIIQFLEIEGLTYKPMPSYEFYTKYRELINQIKTKVDKSLAPSNAAFSGFLMMSME